MSAAINTIAPSVSPLVKPETVKGGMAKAITDNLTARANFQQACSAAIAEYFATVEENAADERAGMDAAMNVEKATQHVARTFADAILAGALQRAEARRRLGAAFGFKVSPTTGKQTSTPCEPGNTIAKRVSSVTIAAEYAITGVLPDKGGDNLPLVGRDEINEILADFFTDDEPITVRAASERIEKAIRDAKETIPLELSPDKINKLAGKIETAAPHIPGNAELVEQYRVLVAVIEAALAHDGNVKF
jgi:hypothetical protein